MPHTWSNFYPFPLPVLFRPKYFCGTAYFDRYEAKQLLKMKNLTKQQYESIVTDFRLLLVKKNFWVRFIIFCCTGGCFSKQKTVIFRPLGKNIYLKLFLVQNQILIHISFLLCVSSILYNFYITIFFYGLRVIAVGIR